MRLKYAHVRKYRSIKDTGKFEVDEYKTILVGPNEAGKTVLLQALQQINPPDDVEKFDALRDYPRSEYNDISTKKVDPAKTTVVTGWFALEDGDKDAVTPPFRDCTFVATRRLDNSSKHTLEGGPGVPIFSAIRDDLVRLAAQVDDLVPQPPEGAPPPKLPGATLADLTAGFSADSKVQGEIATKLSVWLDSLVKYIESGSAAQALLNQIREAIAIAKARQDAIEALVKRMPVFVLFGNYFRVHPRIHLEHLAQRLTNKVLDDTQYDYGNQCLLKLLGLTADELSKLASAPEPKPSDAAALEKYKRQLDQRHYILNAASVRLTNSINGVWAPDKTHDEASVLRIFTDKQYLKVVVQDELGVEVELDQRSEGYRWLVSFYVVFFAEAQDKHENAILLLDEPGLSLHGLKQREFRQTVSELAKDNQTIYTTHSPFLVGPDELDRVRVIQMTDRKVGTRVLTAITADDPAALLPLQEALGYDLAQSLFAQQRNLVLEGLTDLWYIEALSQIMRDAGRDGLDEKIALIPAKSAGKVVYFATILHAHKLKVAALLDSDAAGSQAAQQETLVHTLGNNRILRTLDAYSGPVQTPEIEDMLRDSLIQVAKSDLAWDVVQTAKSQPNRPIVEIFAREVADFSKYRLAKAFLRWSRSHGASDLTENERNDFQKLAALINKALPP